MRQATAEQLATGYTITEAGCWEWDGSISAAGYGQLCLTPRKHSPAHRASYEMHVGTIPEGLVIDHLCRNRACVNPDHLEPVENIENILRGEGIMAQNAAQNALRPGPPVRRRQHLHHAVRWTHVPGLSKHLQGKVPGQAPRRWQAARLDQEAQAMQRLRRAKVCRRQPLLPGMQIKRKDHPMSSEFEAIIIDDGETRPVMSRPRPFKATKKFIQHVQDNLGIPDDKAFEAADWVLNLAERYGANTAQPTFDMDGNGPSCSWCGMIWPFCGHHHMSSNLPDDEESEETV